MFYLIKEVIKNNLRFLKPKFTDIRKYIIYFEEISWISKMYWYTLQFPNIQPTISKVLSFYMYWCKIEKLLTVSTMYLKNGTCHFTKLLNIPMCFTHIHCAADALYVKFNIYIENSFIWIKRVTFYFYGSTIDWDKKNTKYCHIKMSLDIKSSKIWFNHQSFVIQ